MDTPTEFQVVDNQVPTLGDLCDIQLACTQQDPFAAARLLTRWLEPKPTIDQLREFAVPDLGELLPRIIAFVREQSNALAILQSATLKLQ